MIDYEDEIIREVNIITDRVSKFSFTVGFKAVVDILKNKSGKLFADGQDEKATLIRAIAEELLKESIYINTKKQYDSLQDHESAAWGNIDSLEKTLTKHDAERKG